MQSFCNRQAKSPVKTHQWRFFCEDGLREDSSYLLLCDGFIEVVRGSPLASWQDYRIHIYLHQLWHHWV